MKKIITWLLLVASVTASAQYSRAIFPFDTIVATHFDTNDIPATRWDITQMESKMNELKSEISDSNRRSTGVAVSSTIMFIFCSVMIVLLLNSQRNTYADLKTRLARLLHKTEQTTNDLDGLENAFGAHLSHIYQKYYIGDTFGEYIITNVSDFRVNEWFVDYEYETFNTKTNEKQKFIQSGMDAIVKECGKKENNTNGVKGLKFKPLFNDNPIISLEDVRMHFMTVDGKCYELKEDGNIKQVVPQKIDVSGKKKEE